LSDKPFIIGLTGGIGSGKSAAAGQFARRGIDVVDTDLISHQLTAAGSAAIPAIRLAFGDEVIDRRGALDRAAMRERIFRDTAARQALEAILHPLIRDESERLCRQSRSPYTILAVPLLIESGQYRQRCQRICVVDCPVEMQIARVKARSGLAEEQILAIIASQASREQRLAAADDVIDNSTDLDSLQRQVEHLHCAYLQLAAA